MSTGDAPGRVPRSLVLKSTGDDQGQQRLRNEAIRKAGTPKALAEVLNLTCRTIPSWTLPPRCRKRYEARVNAAARLGDLAMPPGNRLEALRGARRGFHAIRINDQWRIVFRWQDDGIAGVEVTDYH